MTDDTAKLLRALGNAGVSVGVDGLLDALLVADHLAARPRAESPAAPSSGEKPPAAQPSQPPAETPAAPPPAARRFPVESAGVGTGEGRAGVAVRLPPGARPFRAAALLRALRPLRRLAPSRTDFDPDEEATAELWSHTKTPGVVVRPRREKSLSAVVVVDSSASMEVWAEATAALVRAAAGVFRAVRVLRLDADGELPVVGSRTGRRPRAARPPCGRDAVLLVVSDCCSRAWWTGAAFRLLAGWTRTTAVGLIGLLPEPLWSRTAIGRHRFVRLSRPAGGGPLYAIAPPDEPGGVLPAASLDERSFPTLPLLLGHNSRAATGGGVWVGADEFADSPEADLRPAERVRQFLGAASLEAVKLAALLALFDRVTAVTLRLIRAAGHMRATAVQDAEVLLGGLMRGERTVRSGRAAWEYRFRDGVRDELRAAGFLGGPEAEAFFDRLRSYLARRRNEARGIPAAVPLAAGDSRVRAMEDQFLDLDDGMLTALGPGVAELAGELREVRGGAGGGTGARKPDAPPAVDRKSGRRRTVTRVYVTAVNRELGSYRRIAADALMRRGAEVASRDSMTFDGLISADTLRRPIESTDAVVFLIGKHYGADVNVRSEVGVERRSPVQFEFETARRLGKPMYIFLATDICPVDEAYSEPADRTERQRAFLAEMVHNFRWYVSHFSSAEELRAKIAGLRLPGAVPVPDTPDGVSGPADAEEPAASSPAVEEVARLLAGRVAVLLGGMPRPATRAALVKVFQLADLDWIGGTDDPDAAELEQRISRPGVAVVLLAVRWSDVPYALVNDICTRHGKPFVKLPAGYSAPAVARHILAQGGDKLRPAQTPETATEQTDPPPDERQTRLPDAYISHAHADRHLALELAELLAERDIECWVASRNVAPGADDRTQIDTAIDLAPVFILLHSAEANSSAHVPDEIERAISKQKRIIPVQLEKDVRFTPSLEILLSPRKRLVAWDIGPLELASRLARELRSGDPSATPIRPLELPTRSGLSWRPEVFQRVVERLSGEGGVTILHGAPGTGKTVLATRVAQAVKDRFPDGLFGCNLSSLGQVGAMKQLLIDLGVPGDKIPGAGGEVFELYRGTLGGKRALIFFDEPRDAEQLQPLLSVGPPVSFLISTTRPLTLDGAESVNLDVLSVGDAVALLREFLGARGTDDELRELVGVCGRELNALRGAVSYLREHPTRSVAGYIEQLRPRGRRLPVYLVLDRSASMFGEPMEAVGLGVKTLVSQLRGDPTTAEAVHLSVIAFASAARQLVPLTALADFQEPTLEAGGSTSLGAALALLAKRLDAEVSVASAGIGTDSPPIVFLMTDGMPTDPWQEPARAIRARGVRVVALAAGPDADVAVLKAIADTVVRTDDLRPETLLAFFRWVSESIVSTGAGDNVSLLPAPPQIQVVP